MQGILRGEGGTEIWNLLNCPPTDDGREVKRELRLVTRSGEQRRAAVSISSSATGRNSLPSSVVVVQDITAEKEAEAVMARAHKADLAGRMASVLGHELNNPLQAILGCIGLAREGLVQGEDVEEYLDVALSELQRVKRIMDQLRHLQPVSVTGKREEVEISGLIARTVTLVSNLGREQGVEIIWHAEPGLPLIKVVADEVHQVLLNLALNALEAMPEGGHLTVRASMDVSGHGVNIQFSDTGPGMASSDLSELFEPFRSSKQGGLGLGLFIVHNIVDKYAGRITVESDLGSGTTFTVWLPI